MVFGLGRLAVNTAVVLAPSIAIGILGSREGIPGLFLSSSITGMLGANSGSMNKFTVRTLSRNIVTGAIGGVVFSSLVWGVSSIAMRSMIRSNILVGAGIGVVGYVGGKLGQVIGADSNWEWIK